MEMFAFGIFAGIIISLIIIGGIMYGGLDKEQPNIDRMCGSDSSESDRGRDGMDRYSEELEALEHISSNLRAMEVVTGLCRTEKETLDKAASVIDLLIGGLNNGGELYKI